MIRNLCILATMVAVAGAPGVARAQPAELGVGVFVPTAYFASAQARSELANQVAAGLGAKIGKTARGMAFARAADFEAAIARGEVHVAVVDPLYAGRGSAKILATARRGGRTEISFIGVSRGRERGLPACKGKRLILPSVGGAEQRFVENYVLEGQVPIADFFPTVTTAPDAASAIAAVASQQSDVAILMDSAAARASAAERGLNVVFTTRDLPAPALAWVARAADAALEASVTRVAREVTSGVIGEGWGGAATDYRSVLVAPQMPRPLFGAPAPIQLSTRGVLDTPPSDLTLPAWSPVPMGSPERLP